MSVVIKGVVAPECCEWCKFLLWSNLSKSWCCSAKEKKISNSYNYIRTNKPSWCPIVELTEEQEKYLGIATESNNDERGI